MMIWDLGCHNQAVIWRPSGHSLKLAGRQNICIYTYTFLQAGLIEYDSILSFYVLLCKLFFSSYSFLV